MNSQPHPTGPMHRRRPLVLITGATGGLGKAMAVECAARGWDLFLTDTTGVALETLAAGLRNAHAVRVLHHTCDLTDPAARAALFDRAAKEGLRFWSLVNVAGLDYEGPFYERSGSQIRSIIRLNIEATLEMTHAVLEFRDPLSPFRIITVSSLAAFNPMPVKATYAASKRFLLDFFLALREEVRALGATVTVLCPGGLPTTPGAIEGIQAQGWLGVLTTQNVGSVAAATIDAALRGRAVVVPGFANQIVRALSAVTPAPIVVRLIANRWTTARAKRQQPRTAAQPAPLEAA